jgi:uroporphyrinogen-III synthase
MAALDGVGVLVTRPLQQAMPLCLLLEAAGATAIRLPAIVIDAAADLADLEQRLGPLEDFDVVVFTSANAVRFGAPLLEGKHDQALAAIGPATARALQEAGHRVTIVPAGGFDSEHLLLHPKFANPAGRRVLIVKGLHGRTELHDELARRGAVVVNAEVYRRERALHGAALLAMVTAKLAAGEIQIITATSAEIAGHLLDSAPAALRREYERAHWLVPGPRVAAAVRERGLRAPLLHAATALDQDLVGAIVRWRESESGA